MIHHYNIILVILLRKMLHIQSIPCTLKNHYSMPLELICNNEGCMRKGVQICCTYCARENHQKHINSV